MLATRIIETGTAIAPAGAGPRRSVVVAGEFNSGKSALINLLAGRPVLPVSVAASQIGVVSLLPADSGRRLALAGGALVEGDAPVPAAGLDRLDIETPFAPYPDTALYEVTLERDREPSATQHAVLDAADLLIWCTMAQRAWTLTEIGILESLPDDLRAGAVLAATRADLLRNDAARARVKERLQREAGDFFDRVILVQAGNPAADRTASGAQALDAAIRDRLRRSPRASGPALKPLSRMPELAPPCVCLTWHIAMQQALAGTNGDVSLRDGMASLLDRLANAADPVDRKLSETYAPRLAGTGPEEFEDFADLAIQFEEDLLSLHRSRGCTTDTGTKPVNPGAAPTDQAQRKDT